MDNNVSNEEVVSTEVETKSTSPEMNTPKKGGNKKPLIITLCVLGVALLGVACFFGYKMFFGKDPVKKTSGAIRGLKSSIKNVKENNDEIANIIEGNDPYEISATIKTDFPRAMGVENINFKLLAQADEKEGQGKFDISAKYGYDNIIDLSAIFDEEYMYFKLNDTMSKYYKIALDAEESPVSIDATNLGALSDYDVTKIVDYLADAVDSAISSSDFKKSKEELTINKKEVKATKYTANITEKKLKKVLDSFLKSVSNDKDLVKIFAETQGMTESEVKGQIKEFINTEVENSSEELFQYSIYMTSTGDTLGYSITYEDTEFLVAFKNDVVSIQAVVNGLSVALEFVEESDDHFVISLSSVGMEIAKIDITSKLETISKGKEYRKTIDIVASAPMITNEKPSAKIVLEVKKIGSVSVSGISDAIDIEKMDDTQESEFMRQIERSSIYKFFESSYGTGSSIVDYDYNF